MLVYYDKSELFHQPNFACAAIRARITETSTLTDGGILGKVAVDERWLHLNILLDA